ncbi:urease accessory protein UreD [Actinokineospora guangxiensis]|uniref:Urease accessory protein UreD n=1 Tax=Actinokineospora guangxiensis TaxID=1490288 RepID=A0ABW0ELB6_9PSEU
MIARARVVAERVGGRTVLRALQSAAPLTLVPRRGPGPVTVHLVGSAASPLGGDDLHLAVEVGPGAELVLAGVAATVVLPGPRAEPSRAAVDIQVADGGSLDYAPEPTVVTTRALHTTSLHATLSGTARLRCRETLVLGRTDEQPGSLVSDWTVIRDEVALLRQRLTIGDPTLDASPAGLAGHRVLATELRVGEPHTADPVSGDWWSLIPLAHGGTLATALAHDAVTAGRRLAEALP